MKDVFDRAFCGQCTADNPDCKEEREAVEKSAENSDWKLKLYVMGCLVSHHVMWKCSEDSPPVASHVQEDEKQKQQWEERLEGASFSLVQVEYDMQGFSPDGEDAFHPQNRPDLGDGHVALLLDRLFASLDDLHAGYGIVQR